MALPDRIWVPGLAALGLAMTLAVALLITADGDPSRLVHAAPPWANASAESAPDSLWVYADPDDGFDGQFFYRLGVDPWSTAETEGAITYDLPALRNARWGYGALAWVASGGDPDLVPWALLGLNIMAAGAIGAIGGALAGAARRHRGWGLLFALWPGFAYSLSLDTSELVASTFVLGGLLALTRGRALGTAALLSAAVLTRDTTTVVPFGILLAGVWAWGQGHLGGAHSQYEPTRRQPSSQMMVIAGGIPLAVFASWQALQRSRFGELPLTSSGDNNLSLPLAGLADQLAMLAPPSSGEELFRLLSIIGLASLAGSAGWLLWRTRRAPIEPERWAWLSALGVVLVLNAFLWSGATAFMRAGTEVALLSILILVRRGSSTLLRFAGVGLAGLWLLTALAQVSKLA